jgi:hypothetical protein
LQKEKKSMMAEIIAYLVKTGFALKYKQILEDFLFKTIQNRGVNADVGSLLSIFF